MDYDVVAAKTIVHAKLVDEAAQEHGVWIPDAARRGDAAPEAFRQDLDVFWEELQDLPDIQQRH
jgi:hypothetical protein